VRHKVTKTRANNGEYVKYRQNMYSDQDVVDRGLAAFKYFQNGCVDDRVNADDAEIEQRERGAGFRGPLRGVGLIDDKGEGD
jgi:hypothetical protein